MSAAAFDHARQESHSRRSSKAGVTQATPILFGLCFVSAITLGLSPVTAVPGILGCMLLSGLLVASNARVYPATFFAILLLLYAFLSAVIFGGIESATTSGPAKWLAGEGRFFLYYWPFILITLAMRQNQLDIARRIEVLLGPITILAFFAVSARTAGIIDVFSSHHAAGATMSALAVFNFYRHTLRKNAPTLLYFVVALIGLLGTGSRTSVIAVALGLLAQQIMFLRLRTLLAVSVFLPLFALLMSYAFPLQYERLAGTFRVNPLEVVATNFRIAWHADPPMESATAWSLSETAIFTREANVAIRGILWARGVREGVLSPIVGAGFGSYNDTGRTFTSAGPFVNVVIDAGFRNPSTHTSHNSFIMIFSELGILGLAMVLAIGGICAKKFFGVIREPACGDLSKMWASAGLGCLVTLSFDAITQHAFGSPIYGMTLVPIIATAYCVSIGELRSRLAR